jgi:hypothetical protein
MPVAPLTSATRRPEHWLQKRGFRVLLVDSMRTITLDALFDLFHHVK